MQGTRSAHQEQLEVQCLAQGHVNMKPGGDGIKPPASDMLCGVLYLA